MSTFLDYRGTPIEIRCALSPRYLFTATETEVFVGGKLIARSGGYGFTESAVGTFADSAGTSHQIEVQSNFGLFTITTCNIVIRVDGLVLSQGSLSIGNQAGCLLPIMLFVFSAAALLILVGFFRT